MTERVRATAAIAGIFTAFALTGIASAQNKSLPGEGFAAIPGQIGFQDTFGPYDVAPNWPKPLAESMPELEGWTWSVTMDVFAESPDRIFLLQKGILPILEQIPSEWHPEIGVGIKFPVFRLPMRQAGGAIPNKPEWTESEGGRPGIDWRWEHYVMIVNREGEVVDSWTQWDDLWWRPHDVEISPYDPEKHVWIVDAEGHHVRKFTNDGKELVLTLGTPGERGADSKHFSRPTFLAFMDANTMYLADGYDGTRVLKMDMNGNILTEWGMKGRGQGREDRPGYWNNVHGIAVDPTTRRVFVNDRDNGRVHVFDEDGNYLYEWKFWEGRRSQPHDIHSFIVTSDRKLWAADQGTHKIVGYDLEGHYLYSWGSFGEYPGGMWGVHGMSTDREGNFYTASVNNGRIQKFVPRPGANPAFMVGKPWPGVW